MRRAKAKSLLDGPCDWPDCICGTKARHWQRTLPLWADEDGPMPSLEDLEWAQLDMLMVLKCIEAHCPSRKARRKAAIELLNPVFYRPVLRVRRRLQ
jgi:hypothetical protein